jgi:hypothetical protein
VVSVGDNRSRRIEAAGAIECGWTTEGYTPCTHRGLEPHVHNVKKEPARAGGVVDPQTEPADCTHESATGITKYAGPEKVWRCDGCGWLYVNSTDEDGVRRQLDVEGALVAAMKTWRVDPQTEQLGAGGVRYMTDGELRAMRRRSDAGEMHPQEGAYLIDEILRLRGELAGDHGLSQ